MFGFKKIGEFSKIRIDIRMPVTVIFDVGKSKDCNSNFLLGKANKALNVKRSNLLLNLVNCSKNLLGSSVQIASLQSDCFEKRLAHFLHHQ